MSKLRVSVEWGFGIITTLFPSLDKWKLQRTQQTTVGSQWKVCVFLANCYHCYEPSSVSQYFDCAPPSIRNYLDLPESFGHSEDESGDEMDDY
jgi:hypothetical protein